MKKFLALALGFGLVFTIAGTASSANDPGAVTDYTIGHDAGGIGGSRHNLGAYGAHWGTRNRNGSGGTTEICVFCHTPHHGTTNAPLWNKGVQSTSYTAYGSTVGGTSVANGDIGASSLACLSCHDGVNTFDTLVNAPGKGNNGSNNTSTTGTDMGWLFTEDGNSRTDKMSSNRLNIGTNLSNDHPISIIYHENRASLRDTEVDLGSINMAESFGDPNSPTDIVDAQIQAGYNDYASTRTDNKWAINGEIRGSFYGTTLLRAGKVECSSCHDPHFSNKSWTEAEYTWTTDGSLTDGEADSDGHFLRRVGGNSLSGVCRTCHNK
jgi:hypothetical protein